MGLLDRVGRVIRANLNSMVNKAEDPEMLLEQTVHNMHDDLIHLRQAVAQAIATQKRCERQQAQAQLIAEDWQQQAQLALQKDDEHLAREALIRRQPYIENAQALKTQLEQQRQIITKLKQSMVALEIKIAEARARKDMFVARARAAQASQEVNEVLGRVSTSYSLGAFERMEAKVNQLEAQAEAMRELNADDLEKRFTALERGNDIDRQLQAMKGHLPEGRDRAISAKADIKGEARP
jgi:phage shock protein A